MVILDTNVLSEALKPAPDGRVMVWLKDQPRPSLFTTTVTRGEILYGIRMLPDGKRRRALWDAALAIFNEDFAERVLSFDSDAADAYAEVGASRRAAGRPISQFDAMIAGMARSHGASVATRNAKDFERRAVIGTRSYRRL
jgi:predicted nucleic acid-binding protein